MDLTFKFTQLEDPLHYKCVIYSRGEEEATKTELLENRHLLPEIAKKNPLNGMAFVQKLAEAKDLEAIFIKCVYHTYKKFLEDGKLDALDLLVTSMLKRKQDHSLKMRLANYINAFLNGEEIGEEFRAAKELLNDLMPGFEKTLLSDAYPVTEPQLVLTGDQNKSYRAFPDMIKFQNNYYIAFREGISHAGYQDLGKVVILKAFFEKATKTWNFEKVATLSDETYDLRDPKFFVNRKNELMLIMGGSRVGKKGKTIGMVPHAARLENGEWKLFPVTVPEKKFDKGEWIWRVTYNPHDGFCYGLSYGFDETLLLLKSEDGLTFTEVTKVKTDKLDEPFNEGTIRFEKDGTLVALIRTERHGLIGTATKESGYKSWQFEVLPFRLGGPNFIIQKNEEMIAGTRYFFLKTDNTIDLATVAAYMDKKTLIPFMRFKATQDCSYPGMVLEENGEITLIYYSGEDSNSSNIFITKFMP